MSQSLNWHCVSFIGSTKIPFAEEEKALIYNNPHYSKERIYERHKRDVKPLLDLLLFSES